MEMKNKAQRMREGSLGFLIQSLARKIDATLKERLQELDIDNKIFSMLMMLAEEDGFNQRQLGKKLNFPEYYTSRNIDALVEAGFAERRPDPNSRRSYLIFLTQAGRDKSAGLPKIIRETNEFYLSGLSPSAKAEVIQLLQKINGIVPDSEAV